jgi:hypothetical protein
MVRQHQGQESYEERGGVSEVLNVKLQSFLLSPRIQKAELTLQAGGRRLFTEESTQHKDSDVRAPLQNYQVRLPQHEGNNIQVLLGPIASHFSLSSTVSEL